MIKTTDAKNNVISETVYNSLNQPLTVADAMGNTTTYTHNELGKVESVTDSLNHRTEFTYNSRGQNRKHQKIFAVSEIPPLEDQEDQKGEVMLTDDLKNIVDHAEHLVFFGGAGVSTGSGIPDFRGSGGLYTAENEGEEPPETILSGAYLRDCPEKFFAYYKTHMLYPEAKPNAAHIALAKLERRGKLKAIVTQNIDGLHQAAGSRHVIELHGSVMRNYCTHCRKAYPLSYLLDCDGVPRCEICDAVVRPDVVLYGEGLDGESFGKAEKAISEANVLIVGGTSLTVQPAASLIDLFEGEHLIIINRTPTPYDGYAEYVIREPIEDVLRELVE